MHKKYQSTCKEMKVKSSGLIIGISIGVVIGALSAIIGLVCFRFHRRRSQIGNSSSRRASTVPIRANGADSCAVLSDSSIGTESARSSINNTGYHSFWFGGPKKSHVVAASGILEYPYKYVNSVTFCVFTTSGVYSYLLLSYFTESNRDLQKATCNFTSIIGQGAFGPVYKAEMSTGETVAVKVLASDSKQGEKEFHTEVVVIHTSLSLYSES